MKVALLGPVHPQRGGIVHFNSRLAGALQGCRNLDVNLFYWFKPYPRFLLPGGGASTEDKSLLTFEWPGERILSYTNPLSWLRFIRRLRQGRYDVLITHWVHPVHFPVLVCLFAAIRLLMKTKIRLIVHNCLPHERFAGDAGMTRVVLNMAERLLVHGQAELEQARKMGVNPQKAVGAFHPVYDQFAAPRESREAIRHRLGLRKQVLLFFGFIRPYKGLEILLAAFCKLADRHPDVSLLVVGERFYGPSNENPLDDLLSENDSGRSQVVWINRYVANEEVGEYFTVADALVVPYLTATQSGPLMIAYAFDRPVIASDLPSFRECVSPGESGYLFSAGNAEDLADKIKLFLKKPIGAEKVGVYRRQFGWERYVDLLLGEPG